MDVDSIDKRFGANPEAPTAAPHDRGLNATVRGAHN